MGNDPSIWIRALRWHTYLGRPQNEGDIYLALEKDVETIEILKFGVRDTPPPRATRTPPTEGA